MKFANIKRALLGGVIFGAIGCAASPPLVDESGNSLVGNDSIVTLVNLHPDFSKRPRFSAVNWIRPALLPMCTEVTILEMGRKVAKVKDNKEGTVYYYYYHKAAAEPFANHLKRYFGPSCDSAKVAGMNELDRKGIKEGMALVGMTKDAVAYALGYPARHQTPSLDSDNWKYWKGRFDTMLVSFSDGKVSEVKD